MPKARAPLLSLSASGKVGGSRRGPSRRLTGFSHLITPAFKASIANSDLTETTYYLFNRLIFQTFYTGEVKDRLWRSYLAFDLTRMRNGTVESASLSLNLLLRRTPDTCQVSRLKRTEDWNDRELTWRWYRGTDEWTDGGGDYDPLDPPGAQFVPPAQPGRFTIDGLAAHCQDALDNRNRILSIMIHLVNEVPGFDAGDVCTGIQEPLGNIPLLEITMAPE